MEGTEGIASTDSVQPATSLGSEGTQPAAQVDQTPAGDAWGQVSSGGDTESATEETATPSPVVPAVDSPPAPEAAPPAGEPVKPAADGSTAVVDEDPFDKIVDPKREDFQAIRADRKAVVAKLNEAEPLAAAVEQIGGAEVLGMVAPLLQPFTDLPTGLQTARDFVSKIGAFDPQIDKVLKEAMYESHKDTYTAWAMQDQGIDPAEFQAYQDFKASGGQSGAQAAALSQGFPEPDEDGYVSLKDGTVLDTANDPGHKFAYDLMRKDYGREQAEAQRKAQVASEQQNAAQTRVQQEREGRIQTFIQERDTVFEAAVEKLAIDCGPDTDTAKQMILGMVSASVNQNKDLAMLVGEARRLAAEGGMAAQSKGLAIDRIGLKALADATHQVTELFRELHELRQQVQGGRPHIPGKQQPSTFKPNETPPPVSPGGNANPDPYQDIWSQVGKS